MITVNSLITHTPWWMAQGMCYEGVWDLRAEPKCHLKIAKKNIGSVFVKKMLQIIYTSSKDRAYDF